MTFPYRFSIRGAALLLTVASLSLVPVLSAAERPAPKEADLIQVLRSDSPPQDKAITCKKLAIYGSREAVPALAPLLADESLASWARIALEVIPDPSADEALRSALPNL